MTTIIAKLLFFGGIVGLMIWIAWLIHPVFGGIYAFFSIPLVLRSIFSND